jgi:cell division protein FtsI (penicillin-binding protein 3)
VGRAAGRAPASGRRDGVASADRLAVRRIRGLMLVYVLVIGLALAQLVRIQVVHADEYADRGVRQRERVVELPATRGRIYDRQGDVLATSVASATVYADPRAFRASIDEHGEPVPARADAHDTAAALAAVLDRDAGMIAERLRREGHFAYVARQVDWEVGTAVRDLELDGIGVLTEPRRVYPTAGLAAQVVGFTGIDGDGLQGLEAVHDDVLRGRPGSMLLERTPSGLDIASGLREIVPPQPGTDLVLTLDREIQHAAERAAADVLEATGARGASVVVLDVATFDVLGMASAPGFDPNDRRDAEQAAWRNRVVTDVFEPGSSQKALTIAAAVEEGIVTAGTRFFVPDRIRVSTNVFTDVSEHPTEHLSVAEIIERSSNVGTIQIAQELGPEHLDGYLRAFGYGSTTGFGFPGESAGLLMPQEQWWGTSLPTIAIGQGVAVTLLQLATSYATLANDGVALVPRVIRGTVDDGGRLVQTPQAPGERVVSSDTAAEVRRMLAGAVEGTRATGALAQVPGYSVGGKTGTARKPLTHEVGYSDDYVATFVGFAPVDEPRIVVAVMVDEPTPIYGGLVAAPLFREVMEAALVAHRVPPDRAGVSLDDLLADAAERAREAAMQEDTGVAVVEE